ASVAVDEAAVKALVDAWLAAQNGGDFAAYEALYAPKLEGIKRVGARTFRFDRAGWLADRKRMFGRPMTVAARDLVIKGSNIAATVELVQTFSQGKFKDEGPKHLVLVKGPDGFQIAREEMLRSDLGGSAAAGNASAYVVVEIDKKPYVVIAADAQADWGDGVLTGPIDDLHKLAMMKASRAPNAAAWTARALKVFDELGNACDATVGGLSLVAGGTPHFGEVQAWNGDPDMSDDGRVWTPAERAEAVWGMATPYLIGELAVTGACKPVVAVDPKTAVVVYGKDLNAIVDDAATDAFRALPAYKAIQKDWITNYGGDGDSQWVGAPSIATFTGNGRTFVHVSAEEGDGCGEFAGALSILYEKKGGKLVPLPGPDGVLEVSLVLDSDGDGAVELVGKVDDFRMVAGLYEATAKGLAPVIEVSFPNNDCGC
ncbi:MAG: nuclear transport factor 2 family protein, partial [Deltaproteobacteria bacterium]|nr:nuclear transport factor 2 family protein [Kofleriaceae bacterium]